MGMLLRRSGRYSTLFASKFGRIIIGVLTGLVIRLLTLIATLFMPAIQAGAIVMSAYRDSSSYSWKIMTRRHPVRSAALALLMGASMMIVAVNSNELLGFTFPSAPMLAMMYVLALYVGAGIIVIVSGKIIAKLVECHLFSKLASRED